jgi:hypothetical protein
MTQLALPVGRSLAAAVTELSRQVVEEVGPTRKLAAFLRFHADNPHVYRLLERFTVEAAAKRKRFGIRVVYERARWYLAFETTTGDDYKLNDHHHALYARLLMLHHPELTGLFELRRLHEEPRREVAA